MKSVDGGIVGFFSLEMSAEQLATRILSERTGISSSSIRRGGISEADFDKIRDHSIEMQNLPFYVDDSGGLSISQLTARARLKRQKVSTCSSSTTSSFCRIRQALRQPRSEITEITTGLKALAKELNVPVSRFHSCRVRSKTARTSARSSPICVNRDPSNRTPTSCCSCIAEEYYLQSKEPRPGTPEHEKWMLDMSLVHGKAEVIIGKQRHGPTGTINLHFDANVTRFGDLAHDGQVPERFG
jgi:replicative DNA helicase